MNRINNIYPEVYDISNINLADKNARKGKLSQYGVIVHDKHKEIDNNWLSIELELGLYKTSEYSTFKIYEPKERIIYRLPYYPDRITHHAIMNVTEPIWVNVFTADTYSCIKNRGIHKLNVKLRRDLKTDKEGTKYCLKMDIKKFYPSIDHDILKLIIRKKIKDKLLLNLLDEIIDSSPGVPIGNYLSQYFANLYLAYFDHWIKEVLKVKYYYRYADDLVILSDNKEILHEWLDKIKLYLTDNLKLKLKDNYQIFPVDSRGIDFVGYVFYHTHTKLRKSIKIKIFKLIKKYKQKKITINQLKARLSSYFGWSKFCNSKNLLLKIYKETGLYYSNWEGKLVQIKKFTKTPKIIQVKHITFKSKYYLIEFTYHKKSYVIKSKSKNLLRLLMEAREFNNFIKNGTFTIDSETECA